MLYTVQTKTIEKNSPQFFHLLEWEGGDYMLFGLSFLAIFAIIIAVASCGINIANIIRKDKQYQASKSKYERHGRHRGRR